MDTGSASNHRLHFSRKALVAIGVLVVVIAVVVALAISRSPQVPKAGAPAGGVSEVQRLMPKTPPFSKTIDAYASYQGGTTCSPTDKPGAVDVKNIVIATYHNAWWGIHRACTSSTNEHKEGRAIDVAFNASNATQLKNANDYLYWLLKPDQYGNRNAMARRLGVMYLIWNRKMWRSYNPTAGWQPYSGSNPHTDHIHISLSWAGARRQTTWWTQKTGVNMPTPPPGVSQERAPTDITDSPR
jgi:hypothetical protein